MQPELIGGRYRVDRAVGRGGMGTVWLCRDETLHRSVAVKQVGLLPGESLTDSARALREARSTAALSHRNVVTVFDVVEEDGHVWLVMEYVPGRSLSEIIKQDGPLEPAVVAEIGAQVAAGLAAAHAAGTMHRDVKPGNVLISEDGVAKISDFGIARTVGDPALTQSGFLTGTPSYFSPELARGGEPDAATDVWALGATLYAAVEGRSPFQQQSNPMAVLHEISSTPPPTPQRAGFLQSALQRMMDRDPGSRWSMDDAAHVLRRLAEEHADEGTLKNTVPSGLIAPVDQAEVSSSDEATAPHTPSVAAPVAAAPVTAAAPDPAPAPSDPAPATTRSRPRRGRLVAGVLVVLLLAAGAVLVASRLGQGPSVGGGESARSSATPDEGSGDSANDNGTDNATDSGTDSDPASEAEAKERFVRDYYAAAPGGTDEAWAMLGPDLKAQGRGAYNGFWRGIESVDVQSAEANGNTVEVTLVYRSTDGATSTERKREGLVPDGEGGWLLNTDEPAS